MRGAIIRTQELYLPVNLSEMKSGHRTGNWISLKPMLLDAASAPGQAKAVVIHSASAWATLVLYSNHVDMGNFSTVLKSC